MAERKYARKYLRIKPDLPLHADLSLIQVGFRKVKTGTARVRILDISPGGLKFISSLNLPADALILLQLDFKIEDQEFCLKGHVAHKISSEVHENEYGFCFFEPDETLRVYLKKLFNNMSIRLQRHIVILRFS
jgi:hypothetical protein